MFLFYILSEGNSQRSLLKDTVYFKPKCNLGISVTQNPSLYSAVRLLNRERKQTILRNNIPAVCIYSNFFLLSTAKLLLTIVCSLP